MRIEREIVSNIASEDFRRRQTEPARPSVTTEADGALANTTDLVCLSAKLQHIHSGDDQTQNVTLDSLKTAYESGAIRPDAHRLAAALLRLSFDAASKGGA